jgi:hypothetical protein
MPTALMPTAPHVMAGLVTATTPLISRRFQDVDAREKCGKAPVVTVTGTNERSKYLLRLSSLARN